MVDWEDIRHFLAVGQNGTLSGAARNLKVDHATVSRRLAALEGIARGERAIEEGRVVSHTQARKRMARWLR